VTIVRVQTAVGHVHSVNITVIDVEP